MVDSHRLKDEQRREQSSRISVVATVFNERASVDRLLDSLAAQTCRPHEIVICDGGSTDGTVQRLRARINDFDARGTVLRVLDAPGANISAGRNRAIEAAAGPIIACTDAGVRLSPAWLERLTAPWLGDGNTNGDMPLASAGFFLPDAEGVFQTALAATTLPLLDEIDPARFLPSSRSIAFTKGAWARAGGYPEWLDYCEDLLFDFALNAQASDGASAFAWSPGALVHFAPRSSLRAFMLQYIRYARGDGKADLWRKRHVVRYATYLLLLPALLGHALFGRFAKGLGWLGLLAGVIVYCWRPWWRLALFGVELSRRQWAAAAALVPLLRAAGDIAKMVGYPAGLWWRWRNRRRAELAWRLRLPGLE